MTLGPEMALIVVGAGLSIFAIVSAIYSFWNKKAVQVEANRHAPAPATLRPTAEMEPLFKFIRQEGSKPVQPNPRQEDAVASFIAALDRVGTHQSNRDG